MYEVRAPDHVPKVGVFWRAGRVAAPPAEHQTPASLPHHHSPNDRTRLAAGACVEKLQEEMGQCDKEVGEASTRWHRCCAEVARQLPLMERLASPFCA